MKKQKCCLLIGNTRWHWATQKDNQWIFTHEDPNTKTLRELDIPLMNWAAVGPIPKNTALDPSKCIHSTDVPLLKTPQWVGVDRALAGWGAFKKAKSKNLHSKGILVADAGTILSLNIISANGQFGGGQLIAGLQLQRSSMSNRAEKLSSVISKDLPKQEFPMITEQAMLKGSFNALLCTLIEMQKETNIPLWLCGGDSKVLFEHLKYKRCDVYHDPDLAIEALTQIK